MRCNSQSSMRSLTRVKIRDPLIRLFNHWP